MSEYLLLQWGHRLSPVETGVKSREANGYIGLQWGHRLSPVETRCGCWLYSTSGPGFNGATGFRRWKLARQCVRRHRHHASMGPPAFAGGNVVSHIYLLRVRSLQWGHRLSPVETRGRIECAPFGLLASMGPPAFAGGNLRFHGRHGWLLPLQWGHRLSPVETAGSPQFTRGGRPASMGPPAFAGGNFWGGLRRTGSFAGFNGATGESRWKQSHARISASVMVSASMGPPAFAGGNGQGLHEARLAERASMGPPAFAGGNPKRPKPKQRPKPLQWGHRLSPVET